ncbi:MAG TPA: L-threonylcarbamoyladenylate synthase [Rhodothermales bacterium]|nr:L-threonylcarbamoyladenylate synthase [Rhodothermales bacterium]
MDQAIPDDVVLAAAECVSGGGILLYPTDTVYGIGGDACSDEASDRVRRLKGAQIDKPLLVLTDDWARVQPWVPRPEGIVKDLMSIGEEHSLTILFPASSEVPRWLIGASEEVGIRLCRDPFCAGLIRQSGCLLSSTSANRTGERVPVHFTEIDAKIRAGCDYAVDGGPLPGSASTIVRAAGDGFEMIREGGISYELLERLLG